MSYYPPCEWFTLCDRESVGTIMHPIIGQVPTCERCAVKAEREFYRRWPVVAKSRRRH